MGRPKLEKIKCSCENCDNDAYGFYEGKKYCSKHLRQLKKYGEIKDKKVLTTCCICGKKSRSTWKDGKEYCRKHYMQMYNHGKILERTIYDRNEWIYYNDYAECITYDINFKPNGKVKFDLEDVDKFKDKKIYICNHNGKYYAVISDKLHKYFVHRVLMNINDEEYSIRRVVDHINGDSLDNRKSNLRICSHRENMKNIRKKDKVIGVSIKKDGRYTSRIMNNYKTLNLGIFETYEEAVLSRITKEYELCGEYGPNKDLFYVLNLPYPLEELSKIFQKGV